MANYNSKFESKINSFCPMFLFVRILYHSKQIKLGQPIKGNQKHILITDNAKTQFLK